MRCCSSRDAPELAGASVAVTSVVCRCGYASDLAKRGASGALLARLVAELRNKKTSQNTLVPRILSLLETLAPAAAAEDSQSETEEDSNEAGHLETLVEGLKDASVASALARTPALRKAVCRLLPALAYGRKDAADALASTVVQLFDSGEDRWCTSENDPDSVAAACLREVVEGLGSGVGARALGDALERAGFAKKCSSSAREAFPYDSHRNSPGPPREPSRRRGPSAP